MSTRLDKLEYLLIAISRDLKYFDDVELVVPLDKFQVCSIFYKFTGNQNKPWVPVADTEPGFVLVFCGYIEDPKKKKLKLASSFVSILPHKRPVLVSVHAQNCS